MKALSLHRSRGQTLLELVVSVGVVAFVLLGLVVAVTSSLRFSQASRFRSGAVKYAQEGMELTRQLRDSHTWDEFMAYTGTTAKQWCVDKFGVWSALGGSSCATLNGLYTRTVSLQWADPVVDAIVTISWQDGSTVRTSKLESYFTQWK